MNHLPPLRPHPPPSPYHQLPSFLAQAVATEVQDAELWRQVLQADIQQ